MIMNPVIQGGAAPEKVYKITGDPFVYIFGLPPTAKAGDIITGTKPDSLATMPNTITTEDGQDVPFSTPGTGASNRYIHFVMPAKNVILA